MAFRLLNHSRLSIALDPLTRYIQRDDTYPARCTQLPGQRRSTSKVPSTTGTPDVYSTAHPLTFKPARPYETIRQRRHRVIECTPATSSQNTASRSLYSAAPPSPQRPLDPFPPPRLPNTHRPPSAPKPPRPSNAKRDSSLHPSEASPSPSRRRISRRRLFRIQSQTATQPPKYARQDLQVHMAAPGGATRDLTGLVMHSSKRSRGPADPPPCAQPPSCRS